ncbi:MAG: tetratricopeptide repeat protein [Spirochaetaceae bacterium]
MGILLLIIILGVAVGFVTFFVVRSIVAPQKVATLARLLKQKKSASAIRLGKRILSRDPRNPDAHYLLARAYMAENKDELALMELKAVGSIGQFGTYVQEIPFRENIAELYTRFNQSEEALKEYLLLAKKDPQNPDYFFRIGRLFEERNRSDRAASFYKKTVDLDDNHAEALARLGILLYRGKRPAEALKYLDGAIKRNPDNYEAYYYRGKIQKELGDKNAAISAFERAAKSPDFKTRALVERGATLLSVGEVDRAIPELERAVRSAGEGATNEVLYARYFLATAYEKTRRVDEAVKQWEAIYTKKPGFRDVAEKLSQYQDVRADDRIKDYLTSGPEELMELCRKATTAMGFTVRDTSKLESGCRITAVEPQSKWRNARKLPTMLWFIQATDVVDEDTVRNLHEEMRKHNMHRGIAFASSSFSRKAMDFTESRPIDLLGKDKLTEVLKKVDI